MHLLFGEKREALAFASTKGKNAYFRFAEGTLAFASAKEKNARFHFDERENAHFLFGIGLRIAENVRSSEAPMAKGKKRPSARQSGSFCSSQFFPAETSTVSGTESVTACSISSFRSFAAHFT